MPSYKVKSSGFYNGTFYSPNGKRSVLIVDKPFKKGEVPSWLEPIKSETAAQAKSRKAAAAKQAETDKKDAEAKKKAVDSVTFAESVSSTTTTL